jgi:arsenate reductase
MEIWINPKCSKCRTAIEVLDGAGAQYTVRRYLEDAPDAAELEAVLERLALEPWEAWPREAAARRRWIAVLAEHPALIQRPIITADDGHAVIGRTDQALRSVLPQ